MLSGGPNLLLVLDSNEYIFSLGSFRKPSCEVLLDKIVSSFPKYGVCIPRMITEEVKRNLSPLAFKEFMALVDAITDIDEDFLVSFELGAQYEARGLKPADAFIAAYAEWAGAAILVSENRHFLSRHKDLPFKILNAESCSKLL